jgi:hypothetical protein
VAVAAELAAEVAVVEPRALVVESELDVPVVEVSVSVAEGRLVFEVLSVQVRSSMAPSRFERN